MSLCELELKNGVYICRVCRRPQHGVDPTGAKRVCKAPQLPASLPAIDLVIPLRGRSCAWESQKKFLERQIYPHELIRLVVCDIGGDPDFHNRIAGWAESSSFADRSIFRVEAKPGCCRIYNRIRSEIRADLMWILEDDILPPLDVLPRLLSSMATDVGSVTAPYLDNELKKGRPLIWSVDSSGRCELRLHRQRQGITRIGGSGLGCILLRSQLFTEWNFRVTRGEPFAASAFFGGMDPRWRRLCDWSCWSNRIPQPQQQKKLTGVGNV